MVESLRAKELTESCKVRVLCNDNTCHLEIECDSEEQRNAYAKALQNEAILRVVPKGATVEEEPPELPEDMNK